MRKFFILLICIFFSSNFSFSQGTLATVEALKSLNNQQLDALKQELISANAVVNDEGAIVAPDIVTIEPKDTFADSQNYFGYNYFNRDVSFFNNIPVPDDYILGPGDKIKIILWGETNITDDFTIGKDGTIFYSNIGFLNLSSKTLSEAQSYIKEELSKIYSTLNNQDNPTNIKIELNGLKSLNIYLTGQVVNPGINVVHPFSDVFLSLIQAGGVSRFGSLRKIQLIRNNEIVEVVDFYSFFIRGENNFSNIKIMDGDTIHVPFVNKRVNVNGLIKNPGFYELHDNESFEDLIVYAGGLMAGASSQVIRTIIKPLQDRESDDYAKSTKSFSIKDSGKIVPNDGDNFYVAFAYNVDSTASVFGAVKNPGDYPIKEETIKSILDYAGGFNDPNFVKLIDTEKITVLRRDKDNFYSEEINVSYENSHTIEAEVGDKILVYGNNNYKRTPTYGVKGEVNKPGIFPYKKGLTVLDAINIADGLNEMTSFKNIVVFQEITSTNTNGMATTSLVQVDDASLDFEIGINSVIDARPLENTVTIFGNVYDPGVIAYQKGLTMFKAIELAGGFKKNSLKRKSYVKRANGSIEKINSLFGSRTKKLFPGDSIFVPLNEDPQEFDLTIFLSQLTSTLANVAAIIVIADNANN